MCPPGTLAHLSQALAAVDQRFLHYGNAVMTQKAFTIGRSGTKL